MKAYSLDLRQKIIERYEAGDIPQRELARQFRVSAFFVVKLIRLHRRGESLQAKRRGGCRKPRLTLEIRSKIKAKLETHDNLTLVQLCEWVAANFNVSVSVSTMCRALKAHNRQRIKASSSDF